MQTMYVLMPPSRDFDFWITLLGHLMGFLFFSFDFCLFMGFVDEKCSDPHQI